MPTINSAHMILTYYLKVTTSTSSTSRSKDTIINPNIPTTLHGEQTDQIQLSCKIRIKSKINHSNLICI